MRELQIANNRVRHSDIAHDAFDGFFDSSQSTASAASALSAIYMEGQKELGHINLRWFAPLVNLDRFSLNNGGLADTYFYADGPTSDPDTVRKVDGSATAAVGVTDFTADTTAARDTIATAIKAEIDRYWNTQKSTTGGVSTSVAGITTSNKFSGVAPGFNLCDEVDRHPVIAETIISRLKDPDGDENTPAPAAYRNFGCPNGVSAISKSALRTDATWTSWRSPFRPSGSSLTTLRKSDLKGLNITDITLGGTNLASIEAGTFADMTPGIQVLDVRWKGELKINAKAWFGANASILRNLVLPGSAANFTDIAYNEFDTFTSLDYIDLRGTPLGYVNARWFSHLAPLAGLMLADASIAKYFYDVDGNDPATAGVQDFWNKTGLQTEINTRRTAQGNTAIATTGNTGFYNATAAYSVPKLAVDICDRPKVIWAELMRIFEYIDDATWDARWVSNAGDVRHVRYRMLDGTDCRPVPAAAINKTTMATVDPDSTAYDANVHAKSIYQDGYTLDLKLADSVSGSPNNGLGPTLNADHFANFYHVSGMDLSRSGITSIPAGTFAEAPNVTSLNLSGNSLSDTDFSGSNFLRNFGQLGTLNLSDNLLTEWDSSWLPTSARGTSANPLRTLRLSNNPIKTFNVTGLDLTEFRINGTQVTSLDDSLFDMNNLELFWYQTPTLRMDGLHSDGVAAFLSELPGTIASSEPYRFIGNELMAEDDGLDASALQFQLDHQARLKQINNAVSGTDSLLTTAVLSDPCRPDVRELGSPSDWADSSETGALCLTKSQKSSFISSVSTYNGLNWIRTENANLSDAQIVSLLRAFDDQPMRRINLISNPNAFGAGFDDSQLAVFDNLDWRGVWQLQIVHSALNYAQANRILRNLETGAFDPSVRRDGEGNVLWNQHYFEELDLSYNPDLFTGATTDQLSTFLNGVTAIRDGWGPFTLRLAGTNLDFDKFKAIIDSIEHWEDAPKNAQSLRRLDVSENLNLWNRWDADANDWADVPDGEIIDLMQRLDGLTSLDIGKTGITGDELKTIMEYMRGSVYTDADTAPSLTDDGPMLRMRSFSAAGTDLGAVTSATDLRNMFSYFRGDTSPTVSRPPTMAPALRSLNLSATNIDCADLETIANGLNSAGALATITSLNLSGNPKLYTNCDGAPQTTGCDAEANNDPVVAQFARFTNLRTINLDGSALDFDELECVVKGLDAADGTPGDGATMVRSLSIRNNPQAFTVRATATVAAAAAVDAEVVAVFNALPNAFKSLRNAGLSVGQAGAVLEDLQTGQSDDEQDETARRFGAQNPAFAFRTPLPDDLKVQSGRSSVRVTFTHNPMHGGNAFTVLRYEYRYRVRPSDATMPWGTSDSERWRTASLDLVATGAKQFEIYGLEPETVYQVQLRASSLAQPAIKSAEGGTTINLPLIGEIKAAITEVRLRAGDTVRLEVDVYGTADRLDNGIPDKPENAGKITFQWGDGSAGGMIDGQGMRRMIYTAPTLPGRHVVSVEAQPDGVCVDHHNDNFGIEAKDRERCQAKITINVSRAPKVPEAAAEPINPSGNIPTSLTDSNGMAYTVFTPLDGGTFAGTGITVSADKGAVPDRQILGVSAAVSEVQAPEPTPGARMTVAGSLYEINGIQNAGDPPVQSYRLDDPLTVCLPMPTEFSANISDIVVVERRSDGSYGILSTKLRQTAGELNVCGSVSTLPATVGVAKLGVVPEPPVVPTPEVKTPETGATAPSTSIATFAMGIGVVLIAMAVATAAVASAIRRRRAATNTPTR